MKSLKSIAGGLVFALAVATNVAHAQSTSARLVGTITDAADTALPGVTVKVINLETNHVRVVTTDEQGDYTITNLPVGSYEISAEKSGFKRYAQRPVQLVVAQTGRLDVKLAVGEVTESVTVEGAAPLVNSETSSVGQVIGEAQVRELPLNGRNFIQLGQLVPGTTEGPPGADTVRSRQGGVALTANGQRQDQNNWMLDGVDNNAAFFGLAVIIPSVEAIREFRVETSNYSAENGRAAGAVVNVQIKSGTNQFHGALYEYLRNDKLDARNFFDTVKAPLRFNQFGGSIGGPVLLPRKVFGPLGGLEGRDHTFFFFNYEGRRVRRGATARTNVPTLAQRQGDFRGLPTIFDPATLNTATNRRTAFPDNIIPAARISPIARKVLEFYPAPNFNDVASNYVRQISSIDDGSQWHARVDHRFNDAHQVMARFSYFNTDNFIPRALPTDGDVQTNRHRSLALQHTWVISPAVVNELRLGGNRYNFTFNHESAGTNFSSQLGLPVLVNDASLQGFPEIAVTGIGRLGGNTAVPLKRIENTLQIVDGLTWNRGTHTLKLGGDLRVYRGSNFQPQRARGQYSFTGVFTGQVGATYRDGVADLLLGAPVAQLLLNPTGLDANRPQNLRTTLYAQDDWKASARLTLNLGLRWERDGAWREASNHWGAFDVTTGQVVYARAYKTDLRIPFPHRFGDTNVMQDATNGFAPRIGLAWRPLGTARLAVRAAYGVFWAQTTGQDFINTSLQVPPGQIVDERRSGSVTPQFSFGQFGFGADASTLIPTIPSFIIIPFDDHKNPYTQQWNFGVEQQLGADTALAVSYVGNRTTHLQRSYQLNAALPPAAGAIQARRRYPAFGRITLADSDGASTYHSLQVKAERRFSRGLSFLGAYTWAKALDDHGGEAEGRGGGIQNPARRDLAKGPTGFDLRQRFSLALLYELPFGRGRALLGDAPALVDWLVGGWQTTAIVSLRTGFPFTTLASGDTANADAGGVHPDLVGDNNGNLPGDKRTLDRWFNTAAFVRPAAFAFGTAGRNILFGPGAQTVDFGLTRSFKLYEDHRLMFRAEFFNVLNHPNFGLPGSTLGAAGYGVIRSTATNGREIQLALKYVF